MIDTLTFADALATRLAETLKGVPASTRPRVDVIGLVVRYAESDSRYQVVEVVGRLPDDGTSTWQPSTFSLNSLGTVGDPGFDPALADLWRAHEQDMGLGWDDPLAKTELAGGSGGRMPLEHKRLAFLGVLPSAARYLRRRLRRQVGWSANLIFIVVTDESNDHMVLTSEQVNDQPLAAGAYEYLRELEEGRGCI